jgi:hypothetical protein
VKTQLLRSFFSGSISASQLAKEINDEVIVHRKKISVRGSSAPIEAICDTSFAVRAEDVSMTIRAVLSGALTKHDMQYVFELLLLLESVTFENETVNDLVFEFSDEVINGQITPSRLEEALKVLETSAGGD